MKNGRRVLAVLVVGALAFAARPAVAVHESNTEPNDPLFAGNQPDLIFGQWGPRQIRAEQAWHRSTGAGAVIAVVDTGVDLDHPDLVTKVLPGNTFTGCEKTNGCGNGDWQSGPPKRKPDIHGTHVAGIAAAATNNGIGVAGVAPDAKILPVKVIDGSGGTFEGVAKGIRWAVAKGADVINLSLGVCIGVSILCLPGSQFLTLLGLGEESEVDRAIEEALQAGVVVVAASGNESFALCADPAFGSGAVCVTATDLHEGRPAYSNAPVNEGLISVAAPGGGEADFVFLCGGGILSTVPPGKAAEICDYPSDLAYDELIGTSMATPHAAGVAALLAAQGCTATQTVGLFETTSRQPGPVPVRGVFTPAYGYGIVDAEAATNAAATTCAGPTNRPPVASDDTATTAEDTAVTINVLANDSDPDGDPLTVASVTSAANGSTTKNADGTVTYRPNANFNGTDAFTYTVSDDKGGSDSATVSVTVTPVNDPPDAVNDKASTKRNTPVKIPALNNDSDPDRDPLTVISVTQPSCGSTSINPDGTVTYAPKQNFRGSCKFNYTISDGRGGQDTATVAVQVK